ncbi:MAG: hypothetical protein ABI369_16250, partial [Acetobacteraceae bacterium]
MRPLLLAAVLLEVAGVGTSIPAVAAPWRMRIDMPDGVPRLQATGEDRGAVRTAARPHAARKHAARRSASKTHAASVKVATALPADARDPARSAPMAPPPQAGAPPAAVAATPAAVPEMAAQPAPASLALSVRRDDPDQAILLPFAPGVGAAALMRGDQALVVFDAPRPLDLAALRDDPAFASAVVEVLPAATLLRLHPPHGRSVVLARVPEGWRLALRENPPPPRSIEATPARGALALAVVKPGRVAAIADPLGGGTLLIGTQLDAGQATKAARQAPEFALLRTSQGVAVEPLSDRLQLEQTKEGFRLFDAGGTLALAPRSLPDRLLADADGLTRRFDLPSRPTEELAARLRDELAAAAAAPPLGRGRLRLEAARTAIALGLGQEALGTLRAAAADDPHLANDPELLGLEGLASLLADRPEEANTLLAPSLSGSDEIALWRALREAMLAPTPAVASVLASTAPLLLTYPDAVRRRLLPLALETMQTQSEAKAAGTLLAARPADPHLALARAMQAEADGDAKAALAGYDALFAGRDRFDRVRAAMRTVDLRLTDKQITPQQGIVALERLDMVWRGDRTELAVRERLAALRLDVGAWQPALALLRDSAARFPDAAAEVRERMRSAVARLLADDATRAMAPLDFVALLEENADLLGAAASGPAMQARLADRLLALDLPDAAAPLLERLMRDAPPDAGRAASGARLAALRLAAGDGPGAQAALVASEVAAELPAALTERRAMLSAQAAARTGDVAASVTALAALGTAEADRARADILERAGDLPGALAALTALADR